jgi:hypothetical protein
MKISFDIDDTIIPGNKNEFPTENRNLFQKIFKVEKIRKGSVNLIKELKEEGNEVGVYTTSYRSKCQIKFQFLTYGIGLNLIINEKLNKRELKTRNINSSKYPPAFDIDIHTDDSKGVELEGEKLNFKTIYIENGSNGWIEKIKQIIA